MTKEAEDVERDGEATEDGKLSAAAYSFSQTEEQPSPSRRLPSSHCSGEVRISLPQIGRHTVGFPTQPYPRSVMQDAEQPSPLTRFPSSHPSPASRSPFPQSCTEDMLEEESGQIHSVLQGDPSGQGIPHSHCSPTSRRLFPHRDMLRLEAEDRAQRHCRLQNAPAGQATPHSHCSPVSMTPFPQSEGDGTEATDAEEEKEASKIPELVLLDAPEKKD